MVIEKIENAYRTTLDDYLKVADPRTRNWFLLQDTPFYVWTLTTLYLLFIWLGPKFMKNREAFSLKKIMFVYNIGLVCLSTYMFFEILASITELNYNWLCSPYNQETINNPKEQRLANVLYWYFFSKAIELNDTVIMILRKRSRQVSFLHVFHHASMLNIWWFVMMFIPGGLSWFGSCLNCLVHMAMYSYYGLSVFPSLKKKLWWKRYLTRFQLIQFVITLSHTLNSYFVAECDFPVWGQKVLGGLMVIMLILFSNFYIKSYMSHKKKHPEAGAAGDSHLNSHSNGVSNGVEKSALNRTSKTRRRYY